MEKIFEAASRTKLRFVTARGMLTVEDLWDLPLKSTTKVNLDDVAKYINKQLKGMAEEVSFVDATPATAGSNLHDALEIVKRIIAVRVSERDEAEKRVKRTNEKQKILALIADKQDETLRGKTLDELQAMVAAL